MRPHAHYERGTECILLTFGRGPAFSWDSIARFIDLSLSHGMKSLHKGNYDSVHKVGISVNRPFH